MNDVTEVFLEDLFGVTPGREIDSGIELLPNTQPILVPPYRVALTDLKILKE